MGNRHVLSKKKTQGIDFFTGNTEYVHRRQKWTFLVSLSLKILQSQLNKPSSAPLLDRLKNQLGYHHEAKTPAVSMCRKAQAVLVSQRA